MARVLSAIVAIFGIVCALIAVAHIALGPAAIPGSVPVNATMDSEDRFYATLFLGFGMALVWCSRDLARRQSALAALLLVFFAGGIARLISVAAVGPPSTLFVVLTGVELLLPGALWLGVRRAFSSSASFSEETEARTERHNEPANRVQRGLSWLIAVFGLVCAIIALAYIAFGWRAVPGGSPVNATMDSEIRFYATLFLGFGGALLWCSRDIARRALLLGVLFIVFFMGGVARLISMMAVGLPSPLFVSQTAVELLLPIGLGFAVRHAFKLTNPT